MISSLCSWPPWSPCVPLQEAAAEEEARQDLRLCPATDAVALGKPTEPRRPQPACRSPAPRPTLHLPDWSGAA